MYSRSIRREALISDRQESVNDVGQSVIHMEFYLIIMPFTNYTSTNYNVVTDDLFIIDIFNQMQITELYSLFFFDAKKIAK